jgi:hypothetical protein
MSRARQLFLSTMMILLIPTVNAAVVSIEIVRVTRVQTYTDFGTNDVVVYAQPLPAGCDGFWFRTSEMDGKEIFAQLLIAQQTQQAMTFWAYDNLIWPGSTARFCKLYAVSSNNL